MKDFFRCPNNAKFVFAACATCVALLVGWATWAFYYHDSDARLQPLTTDGLFQGPHQINSLLLRTVHTYDSRGQKLAHLAMLGSIAAALGLAAVAGRRLLSHAAARRLAWALVVVASSLFLCLCIARESEKAYLAGAMLAAACCGLGVRLRRRGVSRAMVALTAALMAALTLPGLFLRLDLSGIHWNTVEVLEAHYSVVLSAGDRLAAGFTLFDDVIPYYGVLLPLVTAGLQRLAGPLSLHGYMLLIELLQAAYLVSATYCYGFYCRRRWVLCLPSVLLIAANYHFYQVFLLRGAPNHTAWRTLGFPAALAGLVLLRNASWRWGAFLVGVLAGASLLLNLETGIAASAGLAAYLYLRYGTTRAPRGSAIAWIRLCPLMAAGVSVSFIAFAVAFRALLGTWPNLVSAGSFFAYMQFNASTGFGGRPVSFNPLAILIFAHAAYALLHSWLARDEANRQLRSVRASAATMILVWFAYFANRPDPEYLTSFLVLYGVLLIDTVRVLVAARRRLMNKWPVLAATAAAAVIVFPHIVSLLNTQWPVYRTGLSLVAAPPDEKTAIQLSGVFFAREPRADRLQEKARFLQSLGRHGPVVYLTADSYLIPKLSGTWSAIPVVDVFWESFTLRDYEKLVGRIIESGAQTIYFDTDESMATFPTTPDAATPPRPGLREFHRQLRRDVAPFYAYAGATSGWERWSRRGR